VNVVLPPLMKQWRRWACMQLKKRLKWQVWLSDDIGLIVVATTIFEHAFPSSACQVQQMLGIKDCAAFDLAAACAGFHLRAERGGSVR
jgi:hypothetical protein